MEAYRALAWRDRVWGSTIKTYLPSIYGNFSIVAEGEMSENAKVFIGLWLALLPPERRALMRYDYRLGIAAQLHAVYLDSRTPEEIDALPDDGHGSHIGENNSTPNQRVRAAGYALPESQGDGNTVEFNTRTHRGPARALELYMGSDAHRPALMGEGFWQPATVYGIGQFGDDWVVLVCPPEEVL